MNTRQLLISFSAIVAITALSEHAEATDVSMAAPTTAAAGLKLNPVLTSSDAEMQRIRTEFKVELRGEMQVALDAALQSALDASRVVAD